MLILVATKCDQIQILACVHTIDVIKDNEIKNNHRTFFR